MESGNGKVFIGGISWATNEDGLMEYFKSYGEVVEVVIMKDPTTGRARGFGFIVFADPTVAERVVTDKHMIDGRMVEAKKAVPRDDQLLMNRSNSCSIHVISPGRPVRSTKKIFVGGLASTVTEIDFKHYFEQFGNITDVVVMYDYKTQRPRGFGFVTYELEESVDTVLLKPFHELNGKMVEVKRAVPRELSPGPNRTVLGGFNFGMNRVNNFLTGFNQGFSLISIGGYGMRMDKFSPVAGFSPFGPPSGFGMGTNFDPALNPSYRGHPNLNPCFNGTSSRYSNSVGYSGSNVNSTARNVWGNGGAMNSTNSSNLGGAYLGSGSGGTTFGGNIAAANWGPFPISAQAGGSGSSYNVGNLNYGNGDTNNYGLVGGGNGRHSGTGVNAPSYGTLNGISNGAFEDFNGGGSIYGDSTWRSNSELDVSESFGYGLGGAASSKQASGGVAA
ncbi:hypothetical protein MKW94_020137 [Papaver nudicaule]|uniref:RRM domain-containing protein n=1 Tax=Papaver nudicaule TaxID=74823 RepID=A0AA41S274_PAPNU|nr:hypothetical protein [Papaver nudicaule]